MANLRELKNKIRSTKGTLKITSAMKLVSASKLARSQEALLQARPYALELNKTIKTVAALCDEYKHTYLTETPHQGKEVLLIISSDKGLCGGLNSRLFLTVKKFLEKGNKEISTFFIGKKVRDLMPSKKQQGKLYEFQKNEPSFNEMESVITELATLFSSGEVSSVSVAYNKFRSAMDFTPTVEKVLPMALDENEKNQLKENYHFDFLYEPAPKDILDTMIPQALISTLWCRLLEAQASEHGARMTAMDSAVNNCKEAIRIQTIKMNKLRQAAITTELIEVVSGAESLKSA